MKPDIASIAGGARDRYRGEPRPILDPARNDVLAEVPDASKTDVEEAVSRARRAFGGGAWSRLPAYERGTAVQDLARTLRSHAEELAFLDSINVGKPIEQARGDANGAAEYLDSAGRTVATISDPIIEDTDHQMTLVVRQPLGVVAAIIPWNYPVALAAASVSGPLAAGNSVVLKPSPETPLSALRVYELLAPLLPDGVLNLVTGGAEVGRALVEHPDVNKVAFTGSTRAGAEIMAGAAGSFKRLNLELGGKSPTVVFDDAPFEAAVSSTVARFTANQGENCAAGSRLIVQDSIRDRFLEAVIARASDLRLGDPQRSETDIGPMITAEHRERVHGFLDRAGEDCTVLLHGDVPDKKPLSNGFFVPVSIVETPPMAELWREEVFGPVLSVASFSAETDAVRLANDTDYGLMAHVWAGDKGRALRVAREIRAGIVRINRGVEPAFGPWGGYGASGFGRNFGRWGIESSSEIKEICLDIAPE